MFQINVIKPLHLANSFTAIGGVSEEQDFFLRRGTGFKDEEKIRRGRPEVGGRSH
jgi:hypothetical protein